MKNRLQEALHKNIDLIRVDALENNLTIIPVINKIDLPNADPEKVKRELMDTLGFEEDEIIFSISFSITNGTIRCLR